MKLRSSSILGLAISDRDVSVAQVSLAGGQGRRIVQRLARFPFPAELSLQQPDALGAALATWLKEHGIAASRAVVGVPVKWLIAQERELPPADEPQAIAMLRLQVERLAISESSEMTFDVAGELDAGKPSRVLLVGMLKQQLERITVLCAAAGIEPLAVTSTAMVLSHAIRCGKECPAVLISRHGAEIVWNAAHGPRLMRHLSTASASSAEALGGELRRALMLAPANGSSPGSIGAGEVAMFHDRALSPQDVKELSDRIGLSVKTGYTLDTLKATAELKALNGAAEQTTPDAFLPAIALAVTGGSRQATAVNLLDSRLAVEPPSRFGRRAMVGAAIAVLSIVLLVLLYLQVQQTEADAQRLEDQLVLMKADITAAEDRISRMNYGRGYFAEARPAVLDALREVTLAFRPNEPIWVTHFTLPENGQGQIQGKASDQRVILAVLDRLKANPRFAQVLSRDIREGTGRSGEWTFNISFTLAKE